MEDKLLSKLKKLISLSESSNVNEAENATKLVQDLLVKYNIEMSQIDDYKEESQYVRDCTTSLRYVSMLQDRLLSFLQEFFFVTIVYSKQRHVGTKINFLGKKSNVDVAIYMFNFLNEEIIRLYKKEKKNNKLVDKNSYLLGFVRGLYKQLQKQKEEQISEESTSIVWLKDVNLDNFVAQEFSKIKISKGREFNDICDDSYNKGQNTGLKMNLSGGLNGEREKDLRLSV